jgi:hypothetical protein
MTLAKKTASVLAVIIITIMLSDLPHKLTGIIVVPCALAVFGLMLYDLRNLIIEIKNNYDEQNSKPKETK